MCFYGFVVFREVRELVFSVYGIERGGGFYGYGVGEVFRVFCDLGVVC